MITSQDEREQLAQLNLIAGKRAKNAAAYSSALTHFASGQALLAGDCGRGNIHSPSNSSFITPNAST